MTIRSVWVAALSGLALVGLSACDLGRVEVVADDGARVSVKGGGDYTLQVFGAADDRIYAVTAPDGRMVAASAGKGASKVLGPAEAQNLMSAQQAALGPGPEKPDVRIAMPGFSLEVAEKDDTGERARVKMKAVGIDLDVNADDTEDGERAIVRIGGVDEKSARDFIGEAEGLSPETRAEMLKKLGL